MCASDDRRAWTCYARCVVDALQGMGGAIVTKDTELSFGELLREHRLAAGLTQEALAERAGVSARGIQALERGQNRPQQETARRLAEAFGLKEQESSRFLAAVSPTPRHRHAHEDHAPATAPAAEPHARSPRAAHNLPNALSSFIGREHEREQVRALLASARMVTLTGAGGVGKTRLALEAAAAVVGHYPDGVWLVELASLAGSTDSDDPSVAVAVAQALGLRETPGRPVLESLGEHLRDKQLLLVLDNCEHLIAPSAALAGDLLRGAAGLRVLATSRERLHVRGEQVYRVPSLTIPDPKRLPPVELVGSYEAVRLFVARAQERQPDFALTAANARDMAQICARLDGIPLAIELAAARVSSLSLGTIATLLDDGFRLLTGGPRDAPSRQRTLQATLEWGHDLLDPAEQTVLRRLAAFAGGWALDAAEAVCASDGIEAGAILDVLDALVNKSFVVLHDPDGGGRYRLLETVRQFAAQRLEVSGDGDATRARHLDWYLALAEQAAPALTGPEQAAWLARLEDEHDNLRIALATAATSTEHSGKGLALAGALWRFWHLHGHLGEGRRWLEEALTRTPETEEEAGMRVRARALHGAGVLATIQDDNQRALILLEQSLDLSRHLDDRRGIATALNGLGNVALQQGDYTSAATHFGESLALRRELSDTWGIATSLNNLAMVAHYQGDHAQASTLYGESLALRRDLGDTQGIAVLLNQLASIALETGDLTRAEMLYREGLALSELLGDQLGIAVSLRDLGDVLLQMYGDANEVLPLYTRSLRLLHATANKWEIAGCLEGFARAWMRAEPERAVRLFSAAAGVREAIGAQAPPRSRLLCGRDLAEARAALDEVVFGAMWALGQTMPLQQIIDDALATYESRQQGPPASAGEHEDAMAYSSHHTRKGAGR